MQVVGNSFSLQEMADVRPPIEVQETPNRLRIRWVILMTHLHDLVEILVVEICSGKRYGIHFFLCKVGKDRFLVKVKLSRQATNDLQKGNQQKLYVRYEGWNHAAIMSHCSHTDFASSPALRDLTISLALSSCIIMWIISKYVS